MKSVKSLVQFSTLHALSIVFLFGIGTLGWLYYPLSPREELRMQQQRWLQRPFTNYRITLQIHDLDRTCRQEFVARGEQIQAVTIDTCNMAWFSDMTVTQLFNISQRIEQSSFTRCYPSEQFCTCRRVIIHHVVYNAQFGYPGLISYGRSVQPNWTRADFWRRWLSTRSMPNCAMPARSFQIAVTSLTPLP